MVNFFFTIGAIGPELEVRQMLFRDTENVALSPVSVADSRRNCNVSRVINS